jgi:hypothetical protein
MNDIHLYFNVRFLFIKVDSVVIAVVFKIVIIVDCS